MFSPIAECPRTQVYAISVVRFLSIRHGKHDLNNYNARVYMNRGHGFRVCEPGFFPPYTRPIELYNNMKFRSLIDTLFFHLNRPAIVFYYLQRTIQIYVFFSINYHRFMIVTYCNDNLRYVNSDNNIKKLI